MLLSTLDLTVMIPVFNRDKKSKAFSRSWNALRIGEDQRKWHRFADHGQIKLVMKLLFQRKKRVLDNTFVEAINTE